MEKLSSMKRRRRSVRHWLLITLILSLGTTAFADRRCLDGQVKPSTIVGFSDDQPDLVWVVSYKGVLYAVDEAPKRILPMLGWDDPDQRKELALAWVADIELTGLLPIEDTFHFDAPSDAALPRVEQRDDGSIEVEIWAQMPRYNGPYFHRIYVFDPEAGLTRTVLPVSLEPAREPAKPQTWFWGLE